MTVSEAAPRGLGAARHPAALACAAALAAASVAVFGPTARGLIGAALIAVLVALAAIDLERRIIPNAIVLPAAAAVLVAQVAAAPDRWAEWVFAALGAAAFLALPLLVVRDGVGMGDVKLMLLLGAGLGAAVVDALLYASVAGAGFAIWILLRLGRQGRHASFAFGPFLAAGGVVAHFTGAVVL